MQARIELSTRRVSTGCESDLAMKFEDSGLTHMNKGETSHIDDTYTGDWV